MSKKVNVCLDSGHGGKQPGLCLPRFVIMKRILRWTSR